MGAPNNYLIAPAVLFLNPGITREKFVELLNNTSSSCDEYKPEDPWDYVYTELRDPHFRVDLGELANNILGLQESAEHKELHEKSLKKYKESIEELVEILSSQKEGENKDKELQEKYGGLLTSFYTNSPWSDAEQGYIVNICKKEFIGKIKIKEYHTYDKPEIGEIWPSDISDDEAELIIEIIEGGSYEEKEEDFPELHSYKIKIKPLRIRCTKEEFKTQEDLWNKWPILNPDFVYDWTQRRGTFAGHFGNIEKFLWMREGDRYSIDPETYEILLNAPDGEGIYSDFILTAEAIKHNAWKVLSYRGWKYVRSFLKDFPEVNSAHERAIWDFYTSSFAKKKGMTLTELLRLRSLRGQGF